MGLRTMHRDWLESANDHPRWVVWKRGLRNAELMAIVHRHYQASGKLLKPIIRSRMHAWAQSLDRLPEMPPPPSDTAVAFCSLVEKIRHLTHASDAEVHEWAQCSTFLHKDQELVALICTMFEGMDERVAQFVVATCSSCIADCNRKGYPC